MKKALIVTYYWPPDGGGGVQRVSKFCKYLREYGWEPLVLTANSRSSLQQDPSLAKDIAGISEVRRAFSLEPHLLYNCLQRIAGRSGAQTKKPAAGGSKSRAIRLAGEYIRLNLFIPDSRRGWLHFAVKEGLRILHKHNPEVIFSTAPPYTAHLIARKLKEKSNLPWVADFRDPWTENLAYNTVPRLRPVRAITRRMEHNTLMQADCVLTVGSGLRELLQSKLPAKEQSKIQVIPNGYDREDIRTPAQKTDPGRFILSLYGTAYINGFPYEVFQAAQKLANTDSAFASELLFRLVGKTPTDIRARLCQYVPEQNLNVESYIPHESMLDMIYQPQILLLIINDLPDNRLVITGKIFDYLPTGNPILGIGPPDGDAAKILKETGAGRMFDYGDRRGIENFLAECRAQWKQGRLGKGVQSFPAYERSSLTKALADTFENLAR